MDRPCFPDSFVPFTERPHDTILRRFRAAVEKNPLKEALKSPQASINFNELNRWSNAVAQAILDNLGVKKTPVALYFGASELFVVGMLGAVKANRPFVPLPANYPQARLRFMLQDCGCELVLTGGTDFSAADRLLGSAGTALNIEHLDRDHREEPGVDVDVQTPLQILYTSGSTGQPKGVARYQQSDLFETRSYTNFLGICPEDRIAAVFSMSSAAAMRDLFSALLNGATLLPFDLSLNALDDLGDWIDHEEITIFRTVPTVFRDFFLSIQNRRFESVRIVGLNGEPCYRSDVDLIRKHFGSKCFLYTSLATTESGIISRYWVGPKTVFSGHRVPVGYPVQYKELTIVDGTGRKVSRGEVGEIVVKSTFIGSAYWNDLELTAKSFRRGTDGITYRTGDLGYQLDDGCLVHVGRKDWQVKLLGNRIELAEIEATLLSFPEVHEAAVLVYESRGGPKLVAFIVPGDDSRPSFRELTSRLSEILPSFMVPSAFVSLKRFPRTASGKRDRKALAHLRSDTPLDETGRQVRSKLEEELKSIWADVLQQPSLGLDDDFLESGGNSLNAFRIISRVKKKWGVELSLGWMFEIRTVGRMAELLAAKFSGQNAAERGSS